VEKLGGRSSRNPHFGTEGDIREVGRIIPRPMSFPNCIRFLGCAWGPGGPNKEGRVWPKPLATRPIIFGFFFYEPGVLNGLAAGSTILESAGLLTSEFFMTKIFFGHKSASLAGRRCLFATKSNAGVRAAGRVTAWRRGYPSMAWMNRSQLATWNTSRNLLGGMVGTPSRSDLLAPTGERIRSAAKFGTKLFAKNQTKPQMFLFEGKGGANPRWNNAPVRGTKKKRKGRGKSGAG